MKTDDYLNTCLEQAYKSPLRYRHGCVVVRGGKVIGQGYNDYRPRFDGGSLKHGRLASASKSEGSAIGELRTKMKSKKQQSSGCRERNSSNVYRTAQKPGSFTLVEGMDGGAAINTPFSMHSEMMAIHSALAASPTMACSAAAYPKPSFKLLNGDKRKTRLRRQAFNRYVDARCSSISTSDSGKAGTNRLQVQDLKTHDDDDNSRNLETHLQPQARPRNWKDTGLAFQELDGEEKHEKQNRKQEQVCHHHHPITGQHHQNDRYSKHKSWHRQLSAQRFQTGTDLECIAMKDPNDLTKDPAPPVHYLKGPKGYKRSSEMKTQADRAAQPSILPKGGVSSTPHKTEERKKDSRLNGADLYVLRVGWRESSVTAELEGPAQASKLDIRPDALSTLTNAKDRKLGSVFPSDVAPKLCGSLHDELVNKTGRPQKASSKQNCEEAQRLRSLGQIRGSHPCYRCIIYMHSVGIKRVFWTNESGQWECAKVRDLMNTINGCIAATTDGNPLAKGMFITKHEVLMMRKNMLQ